MHRIIKKYGTDMDSAHKTPAKLYTIKILILYHKIKGLVPSITF
jgi:hypothetical protein